MNIRNIKIENNKFFSAANRGMNAEQVINESNLYYLNYDIAVIYKKPTPVQIVNVDYPSRNKAVITEAYYKTPSTTDYNGVYKGYYIDFEVKETKNKSSYPLSNIKEHQYKHLVKVNKHKGVAFLIIKWTYYEEFYLMPIEYLISIYNKKKSISYEEIKNNCHKIDQGFYGRIDYLKIVDKLIKKAN